MSDQLHSILCSNCNRTLAYILVLAETAQLNTISRIRCPVCKDYSFSVNMLGRLSVAAGDGLELIDCQYTEGNPTILSVELEKSNAH